MKDVLGDALLSLRLLKMGGVMIFDDYFLEDVERAAAAFEEAVGDFFQILYKEKVSSLVRSTLAFLRGRACSTFAVCCFRERAQHPGGIRGFVLSKSLDYDNRPNGDNQTLIQNLLYVYIHAQVGVIYNTDDVVARRL